ncbi:MAG: type II CAAX prenyl endopeptidase Rce1 family protein [Halobacterium sp.]
MASEFGVAMPAWSVAVVLALPALDVAHSFTPWSKRLWVDFDHGAWTRFWSVATAIRWVQAGVAALLVARSDAPLAAVGLRLPSLPVTAGSLLVAVGAAAWYGRQASRAPTVPVEAAPTDFATTYPANARERALWFVSGGVTAGVCEEFVYRGVALAGVLGLGAGWPVATLVAALAFAAAHGLAVLNPAAVAYYVAFAAGMTVLVALTGSLLPGMAVHGAWNLAEAGRSLADEAPTGDAAAA